MAAARYWRMSAIATDSGQLTLTQLALSDGVTDYAAPVLSGTVTPTFTITWDLVTPVQPTLIRIRGDVAADFFRDFVLESSADLITWTWEGRAREIPFTAGVTTNLELDPFGSETLCAFNFPLSSDHISDNWLTSTYGSLQATITRVGNVVSPGLTSNSRLSNGIDGAVEFVTTLDNYLNVVPFNSTTLTIGASEDFTIEADIFWLANNTSNPIWGTDYTVGTSNDGRYIGLDSSLRLQFARGSGGIYTPLITSANSIQLNTWTSIAVSRQGSTMRLFINGNLEATATISLEIPLFVTGSGPFSFRLHSHQGRVNRSSSRLDRFRFTRACRYTSNYTVDTRPFQPIHGLNNLSVRNRVAPSESVILRDPGMPPEGANRLIDSKPISFDMFDGGRFRVVGTVKEKALPVNTPLQRRVMLIEERSRRVIRETWSDAVTGEYVFNEIAGGYTYTVVAYDYANNYRAVIADNLTPEPMP